MSILDIIVIGSGCGASPAAANLAEAGMKVCILEKGTWWGSFQGKLPFPESGLQFLKATRGLGLSLPFIKKYIPLNLAKGLFEYYLFNSYLSISSCGVGGGSILIGGFMDKPPQDHWTHYPKGVSRTIMEKHYAAIDKIVHPTNNPKMTPYEAHIAQAVEKIKGMTCHKQSLSFWFGDGPDKDQERVNEYGCHQQNHDYRSSDYAGNNRGAKNSMDITCLQVVLKNHGEIRDLCEVTAIRKTHDGFAVDFLDLRKNAQKTLTAKKVILAAGAINTLKILFASKANKNDGLPLISDQLGNRFGFNGDRVGFKWTPHAKIDHLYGCTLFSFQEIASDEYEYDFHQFATRSALLPWLIPIKPITERFMIFLSLSREEPIGKIRPNGSVMDVYYPAQDCHRKADIAQKLIAMEVDAIAQPIKEVQRQKKIDRIMKRKPWRGFFAVHQAGGAAMADSIDNGVVDYRGEVFNYPGLYVSDASIFPCAPCCGPHYTIMAQSDRISRLIIEEVSSGTVNRKEDFQ